MSSTSFLTRQRRRAFGKRLALLTLLPAALAASAGVAARTPAQSPAALAFGLVLEGPVEHLGTVAREPMIVEHPDGTLFVSGYGRGEQMRPPVLWRSDDGGGSWDSVDVGTVADGALGNSDVDLAVGPFGTVYFLTMGYDRTALAGTHVAIGVSHDVGTTWTWTTLSRNRYDDRPWVKVGPDGAAHVIWNDGNGVSHTVSRDGGRTWSEREKIHPQGGSSHLAIGPSGEIAVRITPLSASGNQYDEDLEMVVVSANSGATWRKSAPPGYRAWPTAFGAPGAVPRWVEPLAWDGAGALYYLWSEGRALWLARSHDQGARWESWRVAVDEQVVFYPYLVARGAGELAATWFSAAGSDLSAHVAMIDVPPEPGAEPVVRLSPPFQPDSWDLLDGQPIRNPAGEYLPVIFLSGGGLAVVTPIQNAAAERMGFSFWRVRSP